MFNKNKLKLIECSICTKEFKEEELEKHKSKCTFLHSNTSTLEENNVAPLFKRRKVNSNSGASVSYSADAANRLPLADTMRPKTLDEFYGQEHVFGKSTVLRVLLENFQMQSIILWGPPGCGKTSIANIIHNMCKNNSNSYRFTKLSCTMAGVNDVKEVIKKAKSDINCSQRKTVLFMDEIHRFNKAQQDTFLPHVEDGTILLIGATTENPSFSLNSALLSRCRVVKMEKLQNVDIYAILRQASKATKVCIKPDSVNPDTKFVIENETVTWLTEMCDGDARIALNSFEMALEFKNSNNNSNNQIIEILLDDIKDGIKKSHLLYDRKGEEHYNIISALHKSIRASDDNAALYWLARMLEGGEDPVYIARRLVRAASEDIGLVDPMALTLAVSTMQGCQLIGMPECDVLLAQLVIYLTRTQKSTEAYKSLSKAKSYIKNYKGPQPDVPLHLRNAPTKLMKDFGYGAGYNMRNKNSSGLNYLPLEIGNVNFFQT